VPLALPAGIVASLSHPLIEHVSDPLIGLSRRVLVDHRGPHAVVAHPRFQVRQAHPVLRRQRVPGVAQIMKMQPWQSDRGHGIRPAGSPAEVAASEHAAALAGEHERGAVGPGVGVEVLAQLGHERCRKATVRTPARDFGGAIMREPFVSTYWRRMLTVRATRFRSHRRSAIASPQRRLAKVASKISTRKRRAAMRSARPRTWAMVSTGRSCGFSSPPPRIRHGLRGMMRSSAAVMRTAWIAKETDTGSGQTHGQAT
jgi:hypothetical protein